MVYSCLRVWYDCRLSWFGNIKYTIGGLDYSTNDVEHGMLRANGPSPTSLPILLGQPQWAAGTLSYDDPRLAFVCFCRLVLIVIGTIVVSHTGSSFQFLGCWAQSPLCHLNGKSLRHADPAKFYPPACILGGGEWDL